MSEDGDETPVDVASAGEIDSPLTWASTGGGTEAIQHDDGGGWASQSGQVEEIGKALRDED